MPDPAALAPGAVDQLPQQVWRGKVASNATEAGELVYVRLEEFDEPGSGESWKHGPCRWEPAARADGIYFPKRDDVCTVNIPPEGDPVIVEWFPSAAEPDEPIEAGGGSDKNYEHTQGVTSKQWTVVHNLGKKPSVVTQDSLGRDINGSVTYLNLNELTIDFLVEVSGKAVLN